MKSISLIEGKSVKFLEVAQEITLKFLGLLGLVIAPIQTVALAVLVLVTIDFITGIWAAKKMNERISSSNLGKSIGKVIMYFIGLYFCYFTEQLLGDQIPLVKALAGLIAMRESKSFFENFNKVSGIDFWSVALDKIQSVMVKKTEEVVEPVEAPKKPKRKRKSKKK